MRGQRIGIKFLSIITIIIICISNNMPIAKAKTAEVYLGGFPLGFDLSTEGALIAGLSEVVCDDGIFIPAKESGLKSGDYILSLNGKKIMRAEDIDKALCDYDGKGVIAEILSDDQKQLKTLYPRKDIGGHYKFGILIRDYLSGLGTVTFVLQNGNYYSLGHPITDEYGRLLNVAGGKIYACRVTEIDKSYRGHAGELKGDIIRNKLLGEVFSNSTIGLTGRFTETSYYERLKKIEVGSASQGNAEIYATINDNTVERFSAAIIKVDERDKKNKNLVIKITDERLIKSAGGIVRGMSGSPIVQNEKIVGAITHVFLNDSARGYGISVNKMMECE